MAIYKTQDELIKEIKETVHKFNKLTEQLLQQTRIVTEIETLNVSRFDLGLSTQLLQVGFSRTEVF